MDIELATMFDNQDSVRPYEVEAGLQLTLNFCVILFGNVTALAGVFGKKRADADVLITIDVEKLTRRIELTLRAALNAVAFTRVVHIGNNSGKAGRLPLRNFGSGELLIRILNGPAEGGGRGSRETKILKFERTFHIIVFSYLTPLGAGHPQI
jgi:hypothetical protein